MNKKIEIANIKIEYNQESKNFTTIINCINKNLEDNFANIIIKYLDIEGLNYEISKENNYNIQELI